MNVSDLMVARPAVIDADDSIDDAARVMRDRRIGSLPVVRDHHLVGIVTDRDLVIRGLAAEDGTGAPVSEVMTPEVHCCHAEQSAASALELMAVRRVRRLPVVDEERSLVGMVTLGRLAEASGMPVTVCATIDAVRDGGGD